ncbi:MAG: pentapeptide repeat-containing protein [Geminicoccaceae bacterium]
MTCRSPLFVFLAVSWILISAPPVLAACTDVPGPDVYWRRCVFDRQDLEGLDLTGATIRDSSFKRADLTDTLLTDVDARRAKFVSAIMKNVVLDEANLVKADLTKANLTGASLKGADLTQARLFRADLSGADLTDARLNGTDMLQTTFDGATWIDGVTICAEGSIGRCQRSRVKPKEEPEPEEPAVTDAEPPA